MKTFEELKDIIEDCIDWDDVIYETGGAKYNEAWKELEEAWEKQIPKKVKHMTKKRRLTMLPDTTYDVLVCEACGEEVLCEELFCHNCGQALDWSEEQ